MRTVKHRDSADHEVDGLVKLIKINIAMLMAAVLTLDCHVALATMPPLSELPSPITLTSCQAWAIRQDPAAIELYGMQDSGKSFRDLGLTRLVSECMGDRVPDIVFAYSSAGALEAYCSQHQASGMCKKSDDKAVIKENTNTLAVLDLKDDEAMIELKAMAVTGDLHSKLLAETWVVLSSIALNEGRERCSFNDSQISKTIWQPALDGMSSEEILELNRIVTSNFRNAEKRRRLDLSKLYPISRVAVNHLTDVYNRWDCRRIKDVWQRSVSYMEKKAEKQQ